jgi:acyl-CoA thioester hydrolase
MTVDGFRHFTELRVRFAETDAQGVVYHSNYLVYCEVARTEYFRQLRSSEDRPEELLRYESLLARAECDYRSPARFDDVLRVWTRVERIGRTSFTFGYRVVHESGRLVCEAKTVQVLLDRATGRPTPLPAAFIERVRQFDGATEP